MDSETDVPLDLTMKTTKTDSSPWLLCVPQVRRSNSVSSCDRSSNSSPFYSCSDEDSQQHYTKLSSSSSYPSPSQINTVPSTLLGLRDHAGPPKRLCYDLCRHHTVLQG